MGCKYLNAVGDLRNASSCRQARLWVKSDRRCVHEIRSEVPGVTVKKTSLRAEEAAADTDRVSMSSGRKSPQRDIIPHRETPFRMKKCSNIARCPGTNKSQAGMRLVG